MRRTQHLFHNVNVLDAVSKHIQAVKLCSNKLVQFVRDDCLVYCYVFAMVADDVGCV